MLSARHISKRYGAFAALDGVDFDVRAGQIHALLGENGAGKSTLMGILSGLIRPTGGDLLLDDKPVRFQSPRDAEQAGIGMVHQHFLLVPPLSVIENLMLGASPKLGGLLSFPQKSVLAEAQSLADRLGWKIPWNVPCGELPVGTQQRVEILKALRGKTRVLIFDEPTAVLTPTETPELFATIRQLAYEGCGIVFISHKLDEVLSLAQTVTVLRRGRVVFRTPIETATVAGLAEAMVGVTPPPAPPRSGEGSLVNAGGVSNEGVVDNGGSLEVPELPSPKRRGAGGGVISVQNLTLHPKNAPRPVLDNLTFSVTGGEIFGIAGVDGNGQAELADVLSGLRAPDAGGTISVAGQNVAPSPQAFRRAGVAIIPADRHARGLALPLSLTENVALGVYDDLAYTKGPFLRWPAVKERTARLIQDFDIRASGPNASAASLSGGNQQKVVLARALSSENLRVLVAVNPTRGLDVGAIAYVHSALRKAQAAGVAIVLISTELDEVLTLATNRVAVLFEGRFAGIVSPDAPRDVLGRLMGGNKENEPFDLSEVGFSGAGHIAENAGAESEATA